MHHNITQAVQFDKIIGHTRKKSLGSTIHMEHSIQTNRLQSSTCTMTDMDITMVTYENNNFVSKEQKMQDEHSEDLLTR